MELKKKIYTGGAIAAGLAMLLGLGMSSNDSGSTVPGNVVQKDKATQARGDTFMEDKTGSEDTVDIEKAEKAAEDISEMNEKINSPEPNKNPETVTLNGHNYFVFGDDMLLPIGEDWQEYVVPAASDGSYEQISEFYLKDESPENWTQKFSLHKVKGFNEATSTDFAERLVNGVLITLSDRMALQGETLSKDNVEFNYVKKTDKDCLLYWGMKGMGEAQYVRVFRSEYSNDLYVSTASYKMDITESNTDFAGDVMAELESIQQLKKKG